MPASKSEFEDQQHAAIREALAPRLEAAKTRKEATRLVATTLFVDHGIYPSAKTVHGYTGRGSLTDIQRDLREFWHDLRERGRVKLDIPGMPPGLATVFSQAVGQVWEQAGTLAKTEFDAEREIADREVAEALERANAAEQSLAFAKRQIETTEQRLEQEREKVAGAVVRGERLDADLQATRAELESSNLRYANEARARQEAEERFSQELAAERAARAREADMLDGEIKFAKMQIEEAREEGRRTRERIMRELEAARAEASAYRQRASGAEDARAALNVEIAVLQAENARLLAALAKQQASGSDFPRRPRHRASMHSGLMGVRKR